MRLCIYGPLNVILIGLFFTISCTEDPLQPGGAINQTTISTAEPSDVSTTSATSGGSIGDNGSMSVTARGICWSTNEGPDITGDHTRDGSGTGSFSSTLRDLAPATTYYIRAYATTEAGTFYGDEKQFSTSPVALSAVSTAAVSDVTAASARSGGSVTTDGGGTVTERGICWSTSPNPTTDHSKVSQGSGKGEFAVTLTGLSPSTSYYIRAFAKNEAGTSYGAQVQFTTSAIISNVSVSTLPVTGVNRNSAKSGGSIVAINSRITERGVCWSTSPDPDISNDRSRDGSGAGIFSSDIRRLKPNTVYYLRAYAVTENRVIYGSQHQFQTRNNGNGNGNGNGGDNGDEDEDDDGG